MYFFPREIPAVRLGLWFILGIFCASYFPDWNYKYSLFSCLAVFIVALSIDSYRNNLLQGIVISLLLFTLGFSRTSIQENYLPFHHYTLHCVDEVTLVGTLLEDVIEKNKFRAPVKINHLLLADQQQKKLSGKLLLYLEKDKNSSVLKAGDQIQFTTTIQDIRPNGNPRSFDFKNYLHYRGVDRQCFLKSDQWNLISQGNLHPIKKWTTALRDNFLGIIKKYVHGEEKQAIAAALVLGYRNLLTEKVYKAYTDTGSVHVLAVSGLHLGIIAGILLWLFSFMRTTSRVVNFLKMILTIVLIWLFALLTGAAPAVLRAATMFSLFIIGKHMAKDINSYNILMASAIILLLFDPFLLFQASFQFSYLALTSILYFQPRISSFWIPDNRALRFLWNLTSLAVSAQILVFPITIYYFHKFPLYFILSGIVAVPFAMIILSLSAMVFITEHIVPAFNWVFGNLLNIILEWFLQSIMTIQTLPFCSLKSLLIDTRQMIIIYGTLLTIMLWFSLRRRRFVYPVLGLLLVLVCTSSFTKIEKLQQQEMIIYDVKGGIALDIFHGKTCYSLIDNSVSESSIEFACTNYRLYNRIDRQITISQDSFHTEKLFYQNGYLSTLGKTIFLLHEHSQVDQIENLQLDIMIVADVSKEILARAKEKFNPKIIVLTTAIPFWKKKQHYTELKDSEVYDISDDGAFVSKYYNENTTK